MVVSPANEQKDDPTGKMWDALGVTKQGTMKLMRPLLDAGLIRRVDTRKTGRYVLA